MEVSHEKYPSFYYIDDECKCGYSLDAEWLFAGYTRGTMLECSSAGDPIGCFLSNLGASDQTEDVIRNWAPQIREKLYNRMAKIHGDTHEKKVLSALLLYVDAIVDLSCYNDIRWHPFLKGSKRYENFIYALDEAKEVLERAVNALRKGMEKLEQPQDIAFFQSGINGIQSEIRYVQDKQKEKKEKSRQEEYEKALERFTNSLTMATIFAGGSLGALLGMLGKGGAFITFLGLLLAACYGIHYSEQKFFKDPNSAGFGTALIFFIWASEIGGFFSGNIGAGIGLGFLFAIMYFFVTPPLLIDGSDNIMGGIYWLFGLPLIGLAALCDYVPIFGGIVCGIIASFLFACFFSKRLFDYQCTNQATSSACSDIIDFEREIVRSTAIVGGILMFLAICAAISLIMFFIVVIIVVVAIMITQRNIIKIKEG